MYAIHVELAVNGRALEWTIYGLESRVAVCSVLTKLMAAFEKNDIHCTVFKDR